MSSSGQDTVLGRAPTGPARVRPSRGGRHNVGTGKYRSRNLDSAGIHIDEIQEEQAPPHVREFVKAMTDNLELEALGTLAAARFPWRDSVAALAGEVGQYTLELESRWMDLNKRVLSVLDHDLFKIYQDVRFGVELGPDTANQLATPTPDLAYGLVVQAGPGLLNGDFLDQLFNQFGVRSSPCQSPNVSGMVFPWLIFEAKSEHGTIFEAQNQAAHGAAKALAILRTLREGYELTLVALVHEAPSLPVVVVCSQGHLWEVSVAFELRVEGQGGNAAWQVHVVSFWAGSIRSVKSMIQLHFVLSRLHFWILGTFRPAILRMIDAIVS